MQIQQLAPFNEGITLADIEASDFLRTERLLPFSEEVIALFQDLSKEIFNSSALKSDPELASLAFWIRKANLLKLIAQQKSDLQAEEKSRTARGITFLIPPKNVGALFCYQLALSLLCGNKTIIRLSDSSPENSLVLCRLLRQLFQTDGYRKIAQNFLILQYGHEQKITEYLSKLCDLRVVWGGDNTVGEIRKIPLSYRAIDVSFADRFSWAMINAKAFLAASRQQQIELIDNLVTDVTLFNQQACTSPKILCWIGRESETAQKQFLPLLKKALSKAKDEQNIGNVIQKRDALYTLAALLKNSSAVNQTDQITVLQKQQLTKEEVGFVKTHHLGNGLLIETSYPVLDDLKNLLNYKDQTLSYYGFEKNYLQQLQEHQSRYFFDNIVPIGQTHSFSHIWDGYNLFDLYLREQRLMLA
ncbi:acyl-CoA reductase [Kiloniella litopenaei]|uniref:acyl-CoA reductase n=1 Tax=Kiloniella litopenaei TaxID=1549748 RepID=UPI003BAB149E